MVIDSLGGFGGTLGHKLDQISCERPYEMKSAKKFRCMLTRNMTKEKVHSS